MKKSILLVVYSLILTHPILAEVSSHPLLKEDPITPETWAPLEQEGNQFEIQSKADAVIALHTLFPTKEGAARVDQEEKLEEAQQKAAVLTRLFMLMKSGPLKLITAENKKGEGSPWPYAMATAVGHGQRILITAPNYSVKKLLAWLFTGNENSPDYPAFVKKRAVSSHGVEKKGKKFEEVKMGNVSGAMKNLFKGAKGQHLYINMPWGGFGDIGPDDLLNDVSGKRYDPKEKERNDKIKLGHLYVYWDDMDGDAVLLIGVETCSPGSENPYGVSHNISSGMSDVSKNRSVNGGSKWKALLDREDVPAEYGGMRVELTKKTISDAQDEYDQYKYLAPKKQVAYMDKLLKSNAIEEEPSYPHSPKNKKQTKD